MIYLDTSALIRFFTKDDLIRAKKVKELLLKESEVLINDVVYPELDFVLRKVYKLQRNDVATAYRFILSCPSVSYSKIIPDAVVLYETTNLSMADCIIASESLKGQLASFDKELLRLTGVKSYW